MITVLITDYERAVLDALREYPFLRGHLSIPLSDFDIPITAEDMETRKGFLMKEAEFKNLTPEAAQRDIAAAEKENGEALRMYKARGYKEPCIYGKGRVKVLMRTIEGGKEA